MASNAIMKETIDTSASVAREERASCIVSLRRAAARRLKPSRGAANAVSVRVAWRLRANWVPTTQDEPGPEKDSLRASVPARRGAQRGRQQRAQQHQRQAQPEGPADAPMLG